MSDRYKDIYTHERAHAQSKCRTKRNGGPAIKTSSWPSNNDQKFFSQLFQPPSPPSQFLCLLPYPELPAGSKRLRELRGHQASSHSPYCFFLHGHWTCSTASLTSSGRPNILQAGASEWLYFFKFSRRWLTLRTQYPFTKSSRLYCNEYFPASLPPSFFLAFCYSDPFCGLHCSQLSGRWLSFSLSVLSPPRGSCSISFSSTSSCSPLSPKSLLSGSASLLSSPPKCSL